MDKLTPQRQALLALIVGLLKRTAANQKVNRMTARNLASVWAPNLIRCPSLEEEMRLLSVSQKFIEIMIDLNGLIFD